MERKGCLIPSLQSPAEDPTTISLKALAAEDRETFSCQTLILTALTAINNPNHHPTLHDIEVNKERIQYMKEKAIHTPVIDAATTILVTNTEILATMTRAVKNAHSIVAIKEIKEDNGVNRIHDDKLNDLFESPHFKTLDSPASNRFLKDIDALLPDSESNSDNNGVLDKDHVFISFPNVNKSILSMDSLSSNHLIKPISVDSKGLWTQIKASKDGIIVESTKISFETHVATVRDYLNWYRGADDHERQDGSTWFAEYIISACWHKMERRIGHWAAVGLIQNLSRLSDLMLSERLSRLDLASWTVEDQALATKRHDFRLSLYIRVLEKSDNLERILKLHKYVIPSSSDAIPDHPKGDSTNTIVLPYLQRQCHKDPYNLYNKETAIEFHHLFVATLLYYATSLRELRKALKRNTELNNLVQKLLKLMTLSERNKSKTTSRMQHKAQESDTYKTMPIFEPLGTPEDSEERMKNLDFSAELGLPVFFNGELEQTLRSLDREMPKATEKEGKQKEMPERKSELLAMLKSHLDRLLPSSQDEVILPDAAEEGEQKEKKLKLTKLKSYVDRLLETSSSSKTPSSSPASDVVIPNASNAARAVYFSCRILNAILVSGAFQRHIQLLVSWRLLTIPSDIDQDIYYEFSLEKDIPWQQYRKTGAESDDPDSEDTANNCDKDLEWDQDPFEIKPKEEIALAIQGWMKLFVQHLHAKSILEYFARHGGKEIPIEIKVYGVSPPKSRPLPTWEELEETIRRSLQDKSTEEQHEMIKVFQSHFQTSDSNSDQRESKSDMAMMALTNDENTAATAQTSGDHLSSGKHSIFHVVSGIVAKTVKTNRWYNIHCEVALASLVVASKSSLEPGITDYANEELVVELGKLNPEEVAVSKLCCPACWEYFDILARKKKEMYKIRGRHSTVYPVELPIWSDPDDVQELIKRFSNYLRKEFDRMWTNHREEQGKAKQVPKSGHRHNPSLQSVSSAITDASDKSSESNLENVSRRLFVAERDEA